MLVGIQSRSRFIIQHYFRFEKLMSLLSRFFFVVPQKDQMAFHLPCLFRSTASSTSSNSFVWFPYYPGSSYSSLMEIRDSVAHSYYHTKRYSGMKIQIRRRKSSKSFPDNLLTSFPSTFTCLYPLAITDKDFLSELIPGTGTSQYNHILSFKNI